jgi:hypothetical protein
MEKAGQKKNRPKKTDKEQFERFVQAARKHGVNESMEDFTVKFRKIVPPKRSRAATGRLKAGENG